MKVLSVFITVILLTAVAHAGPRMKPELMNQRDLQTLVVQLDQKVDQIIELQQRVQYLEWRMRLILPSCEDTHDVWMGLCKTWDYDVFDYEEVK